MGTEQGNLQAAMIIFLAMAGFYLFHFLLHSGLFHHLTKRIANQEHSELVRFLVGKFLGMALLGLFPLVVILIAFDSDYTLLGFSFGDYHKHRVWFFAIPFFLVAVNFLLQKKTQAQSAYPEMKLSKWETSTRILSVFGWLVYLGGYEFLFRGVLLFGLVPLLGVLPAVAINIALYSAFHLPKGAGETIGAIPFGILLCWVALTTGSFLLPWLIHFSLAASTEAFAINQQLKKG